MTGGKTMMRKRMAILGFLTALGATSARAQQPPSLDGPQHVFQDPLVEQLSGDWSMVGAVRGRPAADRLHGDWVLNHQFLRLEMRDVAEPPAYQATVYIGYDNTSERYVAHWLDSTGARFCETLGFGARVGASIRMSRPFANRVAAVYECGRRRKRSRASPPRPR
jgi:hypothetical protein